MHPKISILVPAFKVRYLPDCLDSICRQSYDNWEVIIVDDCSPEDIKSVVQKYKDDRIFYYRNTKNYGSVDVVDNWNKCLEYATGDFCICIGDDDMLPIKSLELYSEYIEKYPSVDVFHARTILIDQDNKPIYSTNSRAEYESVFSLIRHRMNDELQFVGDFCYRISTLRENGGYIKFPLAWGSDDVTAYAMAEKHGIVNLIEPSFYYRVNTLSITSNGNIDIKIKATNIQRKWFYDFLKRQNPNSVVEQLSLDYIKRGIDKYLDKKISGYVAQDIKQHRFKMLAWVMHRSKYEISKSALMIALLKSFQ